MIEAAFVFSAFDKLLAAVGLIRDVRWSPKTGQCAKLWVTP